jgi:hypothetical protein
VPQLTVAMTSQALNVAMLMLGFGGLGLATFSVGMKVGQIVEAAWWKGKLQEALASTREPSPLGRVDEFGSDEIFGIPRLNQA